MKKKKICLISQFPPPMHGLSKAVETLYNSELKKEFDFEKVDLTDNKNFIKNLLKITNSKADLFYLTISQSKWGNLRDLSIINLLTQQEKKCIIHLHGGYYREMVDNDLPNWQQDLNVKAIRKIEGAIVLSNSLKSNFNGMIEDNKIIVVPNCIDDEYLMSEDEIKEKIKLVNDKKVLRVLYLSNFIKSKGYPEVLEMAKIEKEQVMAGGEKRLHFDFAGKFFEEYERDYFFKFIKENGIEEYVTYHGEVSGNRKQELLKESDIFILLSRYPKEGQPISILEAMGNGLLIVTTNHAGIPDIVSDGVNGIVIEESGYELKMVRDEILKLDINQIQFTNFETCFAKYNQDKYVDNFRNIFGD